MSAFPDTGPQPDGSRTAEQWDNAMKEDVGLVRMYLEESRREGQSKEEIAKWIQLARKETMRLHSDLRRYAMEVLDLTKEDLDNVGPL